MFGRMVQSFVFTEKAREEMLLKGGRSVEKNGLTTAILLWGRGREKGSKKKLLARSFARLTVNFSGSGYYHRGYCCKKSSRISCKGFPTEWFTFIEPQS